MRSAASLLAVALTGGCMAEGGDPVNAPTTTVMQWLDFARETSPGIALGFDLDDAVTTSREAKGCAQDDFTSPDGEPGIDNNFALLLPLLDLAAENALQDLLLNALNEGRLLVFIERTLQADGRYQVRFRRGDDVPLLGTDGRLLAGQTLSLHADPDLGWVDGVQPRSDVFEAREFDVSLPAVVFTTLYVLHLKNARLRFELTEDGRLRRGLLGGGIELDQLFEIVRTVDGMINPNSSIEALIGDTLRDVADLAVREGRCSQVSITIEFEAVPAFVFE